MSAAVEAPAPIDMAELAPGWDDEVSCQSLQGCSAPAVAVVVKRCGCQPALCGAHTRQVLDWIARAIAAGVGLAVCPRCHKANRTSDALVTVRPL